MIKLKSQSSSNLESESDDLAPPHLKVPKVVSSGSKSKTTVRYHNGKRGNYGVRKKYTAKHSWPAPDIDGNGSKASSSGTTQQAECAVLFFTVEPVPLLHLVKGFVMNVPSEPLGRPQLPL